MTRSVFFGLLGIMTVVALRPHMAEARALESWPYERLLKEADLVVIAEAVSMADAGETTKDNIWNVEFIGVVTKFKVRTVLKGKYEDDRLDVLHFRLPKDVLINNGPCLVSFRLEGIKFRTPKTVKMGAAKPEYLLFLKKGKCGRYEPLSGRIDPILSVRELFRRLPDEVDERVKE